jgi:hypothetical protein
LLAVQITVTALGSAGPASAATPRLPGAAVPGALPHHPYRGAASPTSSHTPPTIAHNPLAAHGSTASIHTTPETVHHWTANAYGSTANAQRLRALTSSLPTTLYTADAARVPQGAPGRTARIGRAAVMVSPMLWRQHRRFRAVRLQHRQAARRLQHAGLRWRSSGHCANRHQRSCTSLGAVRLGTLWGIVNLKRRSGCPIIVTGGTEVGHAGGSHSHGAGYKIDIEHNKCVDRYIRSKRMGHVRGDGARLFYERRPQGYTVYANEPSHWDIMFL